MLEKLCDDLRRCILSYIVASSDRLCESQINVGPIREFELIVRQPVSPRKHLAPQSLAGATLGTIDNTQIPLHFKAFIVAQGTEAGGHGMSEPLFTLLPQVVDVCPGTLIVAAGGIA